MAPLPHCTPVSLQNNTPQEYSRAAHILSELAPSTSPLLGGGAAAAQPFTFGGAAAGGGGGGAAGAAAAAVAAGVFPKALFLRAYSLYLAGEKRRE